MKVGGVGSATSRALSGGGCRGFHILLREWHESWAWDNHEADLSICASCAAKSRRVAERVQQSTSWLSRKCRTTQSQDFIPSQRCTTFARRAVGTRAGGATSVSTALEKLFLNRVEVLSRTGGP